MFRREAMSAASSGLARPANTMRRLPVTMGRLPEAPLCSGMAMSVLQPNGVAQRDQPFREGAALGAAPLDGAVRTCIGSRRMALHPALARTQLFDGLSNEELEDVDARMREREFAAGEELCRAGEASDRIWVIAGGLVHWAAATTAGGGEIELRMRRGDVIGAQDALTGAERTATVVATTRTQTLELDSNDLAELARA